MLELFNQMKKILNSNKRISLFLFFLTLLIASMPIISLDTLVVSDELGTISNAAYFAGITWGDFVKDFSLAFYKAGIALFYIPIFLATNNPSIVYQLSLFICAIMISVIPVIVYDICGDIIKKTEYNKTYAMLISFIIGIMPTTLLWSKSVWGESLIILAVWVQLWLLVKISKISNKRQIAIYSIMLGIATILGYMAHQRGIALIVSLIFTILLIKFMHKKWIVDIKCFGLTLVIGFLSDRVMTSFLRSNIWESSGTVGTNNTLSKTLSDFQLDVMLSFDGIKVFFDMLIGWLYSMITSTYGLFAIGFFISIIIFLRYIMNMKSRNQNFKLTIFNTYSLIYFVATLGIGLLFFFTAGNDLILGDAVDRLDKMVYSRYVCSALGPLVFIALIELFKKKSFALKKYGKTMCVASVVITLITFYISMKYLADGVVSLLQLTPNPLFLYASTTGVEKVNNFGFNIIMSAVIIGGFAILLKFLICNQKKLMMAVSIIFVFLVQYCYGIFSYSIPVNNYNKNAIDSAKAVVSSVNETLDNVKIYSEIPRTNYAFQFSFPKNGVINWDSVDTHDNVIIITTNKDHKKFESESYFMIENDSDYDLIIKGNEVKACLEAEGYNLNLVD